MPHRYLYLINEDYICRICENILCEPFELRPCGHRYCRKCLNDFADREKKFNCFRCRQTVVNIFFNSKFNEELESAQVRCGICSSEQRINEYQVHLDKSHGITNDNSGFLGNEICCSLCGQLKIPPECLSEHRRSELHQRNLSKQIEIMRFSSDISKEKIEAMGDDQVANPRSMENLNENLERLLENTKDWSKKKAEISNDFHQQSFKIERLKEFDEELDEILDNSMASIHAAELNEDILDQQIESLESEVEQYEDAPQESSYIWKIENVAQKLRDAKSERQTSVYSPPFYTSVRGYKVRLRLYMNGDGSARNTHMSLFFVLMRGRYDDLLEFPLTQKVIFCLYDQTPEKRHIIDSFRPDMNSNSFKRPTTEMNIASGIPKFCPLNIIEQAHNNSYVQGDTIFIRVIIDYLGIPKTHIADFMKLDPGLPTHIQQILLSRQTKKRETSNNDQILKNDSKK